MQTPFSAHNHIRDEFNLRDSSKMTTLNTLAFLPC